MNLRAKLISGFFVVAGITLAVSAIGYWQTQKLASALYEVGVVRLPSIQALDVIFEAKTSLDASKRELLRESMLFTGGPGLSMDELLRAQSAGSRGETAEAVPGGAPPGVEDAKAKAPSPNAMWKAWSLVLAEELKRQQQSWKRAEKAWRIYEPLPQTPEESVKWQAFVPAWNAWRASYEKVITLLQRGAETGDKSLLVAAQVENETNLYDPARQSRTLLTELLAINNQVAAAAKQESIASYSDMSVLAGVMLFAAVASVGAAIGCGIFMSRLISRPITRMAETFSLIAKGDLSAKVPVTSRDEIGQMAAAMNQMIDSLRTSELRFQAVFENSMDAISVSKDSKLVLVNPALLTLFGYDRTAEVLGRPVLDFVAPVDHPVLVERIRRRARGEKLPPIYELTGIRRGGRSFAMEVQSTPFMLHGEHHIVSVQRDITERKRAATLLAESAERLELALQTAQLGVWRRHLATQEAEWDERMFAVFGVPRSAPIPTRDQLLALVVPEDRDQVARIWKQPLVAGQTYQHRYRITRPDGVVRHLEAHGMIQDLPGQPAEWAIGVTNDITDIVDAAAESARLREQLLQAQKMETLGTLSAGIAHDFNNLLTGINGYVELAAATVPPGHEAAELLKLARQGTMSARELVRRILNFSRQSRTTQRVALNLGEVARDTTQLIMATLPSNVTLALDLAPGLPLVLADAGQVQQVMMNLCVNGTHAIGTQHGSLRIGLRSCEFRGAAGEALPSGCRAGPYVCLSVSDTGCGMNPATLQRIFEPFFTTKKPGEGTGLGLSIVHDIVATHEGGIAVTSTVGLGTTFSLYFPVSQDAAPAAVAPKARSLGRGAGQRVMVVDDEPSISRVVQLALQKGGYAPEVFTSSLEAWNRFATAPAEFQLLMIDQQMPGLSGSDFIARARELAPALPVIRMSGRFERSDTATTPGAPGISHLKKPFEIVELLEQVATVLKS